MAFINYPSYLNGEDEEEQQNQQQPSENEPSQDEPQEPSENEPIQDEPPQKRINAAPRNNIYAPGTGPGTGRTAVRIGTTNRDGSTSPVGALGAATGTLSQPLPRMNASPAPTYSSGQQNQQTGDDSSESNNSITGGLPSRPGRINAAPRNNIYAPGTGPGTGRTAVRMGTLNRDGSTSPVGALGAATGTLSQPLPRMQASPAPTYSSGQQGQQTGDDSSESNNSITGGLPSRPGRINAAPRNNIYAPGTGPGTGRTAVRMGTTNRDGSTSPVGALGAATGPLSQPTSRWMTPRPPPAQAFAQRQSNVDQAKANGTFDAAREKFNAANPGHSMDESGNITQRGAAPGSPTPLFFKARQPSGAASATTPKTPAAPAQSAQFASAPDGQGGSKMVKLPAKPAPAAPATPAAAAQPAQFVSAPDGQGGSKMVKLPPKPAPAAPATPAAPAPAATPSAPKPPLAAAAGPAPAGKSALTINIPSATHTGAPKPPFAAAGQTSAGKPALTINIPSATQTSPATPPAATAPNAPASTTPASPSPAPPTKAPATFEGQSRDKFFGDAQRHQGVDNAYAKAPEAPLAPPGASAPAPTQKTKRK